MKDPMTPTQNREREAIRIMELIGQAFDLVGLRPLPNHWDDCSGREKDAFLELANKLVPAEAPPAAPPPVGVERLAAEIWKDWSPSSLWSVAEIEARIEANPDQWPTALGAARRALALLHPQPAGRGDPEPVPHTSHEWKEESNPTGWHGEIGCTACGIGVGDPGTYQPCPATPAPPQSPTTPTQSERNPQDELAQPLEALETIAHDHSEHAKLQGHDWSTVLGWAQHHARRGLGLPQNEWTDPERWAKKPGWIAAEEELAIQKAANVELLRQVQGLEILLARLRWSSDGCEEWCALCDAPQGQCKPDCELAQVFPPAKPGHYGKLPVQLSEIIGAAKSIWHAPDNLASHEIKFEARRIIDLARSLPGEALPAPAAEGGRGQ